MTSINFGLKSNSAAKSKKPGFPTSGPPTRKPIARKPPPGFFGAGSDHEDNARGASDNGEEGEASVFSQAKKPTSSTSKGPTPSSASTSRSRVNADLASHTAHSTHLTTSAVSSAEAVDPTIYAYDSLYDTIKSAQSRTKPTTEADAARQPKYMASLLAAAGSRKREQLRVKERMLQREREAEGEEFADKETFVTEAYKKQQAELRQAEKEEELREEAEKRRKERMGESGMTGFYRGVLQRVEGMHEVAVLAAASASAKGVVDGDELPPQMEGEKKQESRPLGVEVNDDGVVVDKRQLLSAGLNLVVSKKPSSTRTSSSHGPSNPTSSSHRFPGNSKSALESSRVRQTRMLELQLEERQKRAREEEETKAREVMEKQVKRNKTEAEVGSARERYLARKKAKEEEDARAKAGGGVS